MKLNWGFQLHEEIGESYKLFLMDLARFGCTRIDRKILATTNQIWYLEKLGALQGLKIPTSQKFVRALGIFFSQVDGVAQRLEWILVLAVRTEYEHGVQTDGMARRIMFLLM